MQAPFNDSRAAQSTVPLTRSANAIGSVVEGTARSEGEGFPVGSQYTALLTERVNKSNPRNQGPTRASANSATIPVVSQGIRKTGRI